MSMGALVFPLPDQHASPIQRRPSRLHIHRAPAHISWKTSKHCTPALTGSPVPLATPALRHSSGSFLLKSTSPSRASTPDQVDKIQEPQSTNCQKKPASRRSAIAHQRQRRHSRLLSEMPVRQRFDLDLEVQSLPLVQPIPVDTHKPSNHNNPHVSTDTSLSEGPKSFSFRPSTAPRKPRTWATTFQRHATALAAQISLLRQPVAPPRINTQAEFRRNFIKNSRDRVIRDTNGNCFRLCPIMMNGDCGFASIAKGINIAREFLRRTVRHSPYISSRISRRLSFRFWQSSKLPPKRILQPKDIRIAMYNELRKAKKTYLADLGRDACIFTDSDLDRLEREVSRPGIAGHWLGTVLGILEHVIVARAMNINIYLYQFDLKKQCVRQFECAIVENADCDVFLFFTGPPASGHFDALVKIPDVLE